MKKKPMTRPKPKAGRVPKPVCAPPWVDTQYGADWGDLFRILRVASNRDGEHNRFAILEVVGKDGTIINITARPTQTTVRVTPIGGRRK